MPVTNLDLRGRNDLPDLAAVLGTINTAAYLFGDEEKQNPDASPDVKSYLQMNTTDDKFPILVRRNANGNGMELSASSAALDLALSQSPGPDGQSNGWPSYRHRQAQQSLPTNTFRKGSQVDEYETGQANNNVETTPTKSMGGNRRSVEFSFSPMNSASKRSSYHASPSNGMPKLQQSYSTSDVPTLKNGDGVNGVGASGVNSHAEQHLQNHNASLGRIPPSALSNRHSRELSTGYKDQEYRPMQSGLHASAAPFGPSTTSAAPVNASAASTIGSPTMSQYSTSTATTAPYYGYGMSMLNGAMSGLSLGGPQVGAPPPYYPNGGMYSGVPQTFNPYATYGPNGRVQDSQARVIQTRRMQNGTPYLSSVLLTRSNNSDPDANRFVNYDLKTMAPHEIYTLCKDQHGCRFLQKKLEERNTEYLQIIFDETAPHVVELMTGIYLKNSVTTYLTDLDIDPFGNYLCQKLLEYTNDEQRNTLVRNAAPSLVQIALNQHGTRALQKMIEFISTSEQVSSISFTFPRSRGTNPFTDPDDHQCPGRSGCRSYPGPERQPRHPEVLEPPQVRGRPVHL